MKRGTVYFVGAGPGDPKLITVRGAECLRAADVIIYDRLANAELLDYAGAEAELIYCGKMPNDHTLRQEQINQLLVDKALEGKTVTRLKGGDPSVFGRVGEEAEAVARHGIRFEIVPGITSGIAAAAYAGIPVTHRDYASSFALVTGHHRDDASRDRVNWEALAKGVDTIAFYMGVHHLSYICDQLIKHGRAPETPAALIRWGTMPDQMTVTGTLATIGEQAHRHRATHPAIILVGEVVKLRDRLQWFENKYNEEQGMEGEMK